LQLNPEQNPYFAVKSRSKCIKVSPGFSERSNVVAAFEHRSLWSDAKSAALPLPELQASLMLLASDALSKFDGSTAPATPPSQQQSPPAHQPPVAEAHPTPPPQAATETASVPSQPAATAVPAPVVPVAEPTQAVKTPPEGDSTEKEEEEEEQARQEGPPAAATNLNSAKAEAKLVKALDYLVAINDNPGQKWVINESILRLPYRLFWGRLSKNSLKLDRSFINQANNTHGLGVPVTRRAQLGGISMFDDWK
jgi:hypothetical protein